MGEKEHSEQLIDDLVQLDEQVAAHRLNTPDMKSGDTETAMGGEFAGCLQMLNRVRQGAPVWPDEADGQDVDLSWLYRDEAQPQQIGRFVIKRRLGAGGFGLVFLAHDPELDRDVALKVPRLETLAGEDARRRFLRESKIAAALAQLEQAPGPVTLPPDARCELLTADARHVLEAAPEDEHDHGHEHAEESRHSECVATYRYECARVDRLNRIEVTLFGLFPLTIEVATSLIGPDVQTFKTLTKDDLTLAWPSGR